jgi:predicted porin
MQVAGYVSSNSGSGSDPLGFAGNSGNRFSNALFYNSPEFAGFQVNTTVGTKENAGSTAVVGTAPAAVYAAGSEASVNPYSISATYKNGPAAVMLATERNAVETRLWSIAGAIYPMPELKLMASYQRQNQEHTKPVNTMTKAWVLGANYTMGPGKLLAGYGQKSPDGIAKTKQVSIGYEYSLSKRTYLYVDASQRKGGVQTASQNIFALGVNHAF